MAGNLEGVPVRKEQENDAIPKIAPKWLKHDRQVSHMFDVAPSKFDICCWVSHFAGFNSNFYILHFKFFNMKLISLIFELFDC